MDAKVVGKNIEPSHIVFKANYKEVLRIDEEGFHFKGEVIKDGGKAYNVWMEVMNLMKESKTPPSLWWRLKYTFCIMQSVGFKYHNLKLGWVTSKNEQYWGEEPSKAADIEISSWY